MALLAAVPTHPPIAQNGSLAGRPLRLTPQESLTQRAPYTLCKLAVVGQVDADPLIGRALLAPGKGERPRQVRLAHPVQDLHQRRAHRVQVGPHRLPRLVAPSLVVGVVPGLNVHDVSDPGRLAGGHSRWVHRVAQPFHARPLPVGHVGQRVFGPTYPNRHTSCHLCSILPRPRHPCKVAQG